jgi:hypothetical protein
MKLCTMMLILLLTTAASAQEYDARFWEHWSDGHAELASYDLTINRYGEPRRGQAVAIFVTETFSSDLRVKADRGNHPESDEFPIMKLNLVQDFQTGIYDYNLMTSVFVALEPVHDRPAGTPTKITFSSQEWCGQVWHQLLFDSQQIREESFSYFDGEADQSGAVEFPPDGISEDQLLLWARGLAAPKVLPDAPVRVPILRSLEHSRLQHRELRWSSVELSVADETRTTRVPAGEFMTRLHTAVIEDGPTWSFEIEDEFPHRLIRWGSSAGKLAELRGVDRLKYWQLNGDGDERSLERIGLD